jgi:hypothetical protein
MKQTTFALWTSRRKTCLRQLILTIVLVIFYQSAQAQYDSVIARAWRLTHQRNVLSLDTAAALYRLALYTEPANLKALGGLAEVYALKADNVPGGREFFIDSAFFYAGKALSIAQSRQEHKVISFQKFNSEHLANPADAHSQFNLIIDYNSPVTAVHEVWYYEIWLKRIKEEELFYEWTAQLQNELQAIKDLRHASFAMALAFRQLQKQGDGAKWLKKVLEVEPDYPGAAGIYANLACNTGQLFDCWYWSGKLLQTEPTNTDCIYTHARANALLGNDEKADSLFSYALRKTSSCTSAWIDKAFLQMYNGKTKEAAANVKILVEQTGDPAHKLVWAYLLAAHKSYNQAYSITNQVVSGNTISEFYGGARTQVLQAYLLSKFSSRDSTRRVASFLLRRYLPELDKQEYCGSLHKDVAALYCLLWRKDDAVAHLKIGFQQGLCYRSVYYSPYFEILRNYDPFERLIKSENSRVEKIFRRIKKSEAGTKLKNCINDYYSSH